MKKLTVNLKEKSYPIYIEDGLISNIKAHLEENKKYFVITNSTIYDIYKTFLDGFEHLIIIPDGEEFKNFETYKYIVDKLIENKIERNDAIIAFGGGVVGDLAGFCASSVLRGVDFIQIPTTLLAQVDSSVGGKTGFNHPLGKNLIGTFYQPKKVLIDPSVLKTLGCKQIKTGLGEVLKYAFIEKSVGHCEKFNLFEYLENFDLGTFQDKLQGEWEEIIYMCVSLKATVVECDEKEKGLRSILNFGHTFGHAVEKITQYKKYTHGEAVAMGMMMAFNLALKRELILDSEYKKAIELIKKYDLVPFDSGHFGKFDKEAIYEAMKSDKKVNNLKIKLVLPVTQDYSTPVASNYQTTAAADSTASVSSNSSSPVTQGCSTPASSALGSVGLFADNSELLIKDSVL